MYKSFFKRFLDFYGAFFGLVLLSPIFLMVTLALFITNNGKPFFFQSRPGKNERIFKIIKFKSMNDKKDEEGKLLPDAKRLTKMGSFVRKTSLDEIPQLINVLKGDMSLIGPRPLLTQYLPYYTDREKLRHKVRPGITGLAQISGRNNLSWEKRLELDVRYIENLSLVNDFKILIKTVNKVFKKEGVVVALDPKVNIPLNIYRQNNRK